MSKYFLVNLIIAHVICAVFSMSKIQPFVLCLTLSSLNFHCRLHPLQAANCCRNSRIVVDEDDLKSVANEKNRLLLLKEFNGNFCSKTPDTVFENKIILRRRKMMLWCIVGYNAAHLL